MKNNLLLHIIFVMFISQACSVPEYLPEPAEIPTYNKGAFIRITDNDFNRFTGEIIAVEKENKLIIILTCQNNNSQIKKINWDEIRSLKVHYAKGRNFIPSISTSFITISHGLVLIFSAPVNLITTIIISYNAYNEYTLSYNAYDYLFRKRQIGFEEMYLFARFPQGIPEGVSIDEIR